MSSGPLLIIEQKACHDIAQEKIEYIGHANVRVFKGEEYESTKYNITTNGCDLEFLWPTDSRSVRMYKQTMRFGVLVGYDKTRQLYNVETD